METQTEEYAHYQSADRELQFADWHHPDYLPCKPCYPGIDNIGNSQCTECLALLDDGAVKKCLEILYGENWKQMYDLHKEVAGLVEKKKFDQLRAIDCTYHLDDGTIKTRRCFYEKKW